MSEYYVWLHVVPLVLHICTSVLGTPICYQFKCIINFSLLAHKFSTLLSFPSCIIWFQILNLLSQFFNSATCAWIFMWASCLTVNGLTTQYCNLICDDFFSWYLCWKMQLYPFTLSTLVNLLFPSSEVLVFTLKLWLMIEPLLASDPCRRSNDGIYTQGNASCARDTGTPWVTSSILKNFTANDFFLTC